MTRVALRDLVSIKHGFAFPGTGFVKTRTPDLVLTPGNFRIGGGFKIARPKFFEGSFPAEYILQPGDVIVTMTDLSKTGDTLGYPAIVPRSTDGTRYLHNQRLGLIIVNEPERLSADYLYYRLCCDDYRHEVLASATGSTVRHTSPGRILDFEFELPPMEEQLRIAETLSALDDRIAGGARQRQLLRELGTTHLQKLLATSAVDARPLAAFVRSIARGVTPKYTTDGSGAVVLNQKCIRDGWATVGAARLMAERAVSEEKRASSGDILVNSTGVGTLGRVARWHSGDVYADSHVSIVKPDSSMLTPTVLAYSVLEREREIESMATGSTGQTELSPTRLGELQVQIPVGAAAASLEAFLSSVEDRVATLFDEELALSTLRQVLLPKLVAGDLAFVPREGAPA